MSWNKRSRRDWRIILWVSLSCAAISAWFGIRISPDNEPPLRGALTGIATSLVIATPILLVQIKGNRSQFMRRLQRLPLAAYFAIKLLFYVTVIVGGLVLSRYLFSPTPGLALDPIFRRSLVFATGMAVIGNLVFDMGGLLGFGTLKNLLTGRYVQPRSEQRIFLLIDMRDSTGLAERLGAVRFHELLNDFFRDVADAALACEAEIHKYVGDEAILTWPTERALADGDCLACPFVARDLISAHGDAYRSRYGAVPEFRAALHCGEIVVGDTLNVAARLLDAAKMLGRDVLVSTDLLGQAKLPPGLRAEALPTLAIRGHSAPLGVAALERA
ncbi:MAG: adenylate/guanylate cyclase domain-containing protein [Alphaproteobacteria bacterium]|nr:adenylate/guanylate cyclase domain-containing protein [Alphaproteobacteria bacterium]